MNIARSVPVRVEIAALVVTLAGIGLQIASGVHYGAVPPGVVILAALVLLLILAPWLPVRLAGFAVPAFILLGAFVSRNGRTNISHPGRIGAFTGTVIQLLGLTIATVAAIVSVVEWGAARRRARPGRRPELPATGSGPEK